MVQNVFEDGVDDTNDVDEDDSNYNSNGAFIRAEPLEGEEHVDE